MERCPGQCLPMVNSNLALKYWSDWFSSELIHCPFGPSTALSQIIISFLVICTRRWKNAILGGLPWTPLRTLNPPHPLKGVWYSTPQTYNRLELIALQLLWFLRDIPFWSVSPSILYTVKFEVLGGTLNMQKVELFFTWWSPWVQMNGIGGLKNLLSHFWQYDTPYYTIPTNGWLESNLKPNYIAKRNGFLFA